MTPQPLKALKDAIELVVGPDGKLKDFARKIGREDANVSNWLHRDKKAPIALCGAIERATDGQITKAQLRPDIFGEA